MARWFTVRTFVLGGVALGCTPLPPAPTYRPADGSAMEASAADHPATPDGDAPTPEDGDAPAMPDGDVPAEDVSIDGPDGDAPAADVALLDASDAPTDAAPPDAPPPGGPRLTGGFVASGSTGPRLSGGFVWAGGSSRLSGWLR